MSVFSEVIEEIEVGNIDNAISKYLGLMRDENGEPLISQGTARKIILEVQANLERTAKQNKMNTRVRKLKNEGSGLKK